MAVFRSCVLELSAAVFYRVDEYIAQFPFRLVRMVHPSCSEEQRLAESQALKDAHDCCLDPFFSRRLKMKYALQSASAVLESTSVTGCLRAWMEKGRVTVHHVESMHAQNRHSFQTDCSHRRHAEGALYHSYLRKLMRGHTARGRMDNSLPRSRAAFAKKLGLK
eukprot:7783802-Pyramimonas_sp.AAC.1